MRQANKERSMQSSSLLVVRFSCDIGYSRTPAA